MRAEQPVPFVSAHIVHNTVDLRLLLVECVDPLVATLVEKGLLSRFFFLRYWEGGTHVRLRIAPNSESQADDVRRVIDATATRFFTSQPSIFDVDVEAIAPVLRSLYEFEYGKEAFVKRFGADGRIPVLENNSIQYIAYEPEYGRYGGPEGVALAHEIFHLSSLLALRIVRDANSRVRNGILGSAFQVMTHFVYAYYGARQPMINFFSEYAQFYDRMDSRWNLDLPPYETIFESQSKRMTGYGLRLEAMHEHISNSSRRELTNYLNAARRIRSDLAALYQANRLRFDPPASSWEEASSRALASYVHMMNNRLGVLSYEETYLANMIYRAIEKTG